MIKEVTRMCNRLTNILGITVKLPAPNKGMLKGASMLNLVVGTGLLTAGVVLVQKWCAVAGGISIASSLILRHEAKNR